MGVTIDTSEIDDLIHLFERRAEYMVSDAVRDGTAAAQNWQAKQVPHPGKMHRRIKRLRQPHKTASGPSIAVHVERAIYHRLFNFFVRAGHGHYEHASGPRHRR